MSDQLLFNYSDDILIHLFLSALERHNGNNTWEKEAEDYFVSRLANSAVWSSIPSLNEVAIKDVQQGQLVRFRGMIQDQMGLELYGSGALVKDSVSNTQKMVTGKFKDELALGVSKLI